MIGFLLLILLLIWAIIVLFAEKKHYQKHFDEFYEQDKPIKFCETVKEFQKMKHLNKQLKKNGGIS